MQSCLSSWRTKGRVYQAVVRSILLYGCETWTLRVTDERMLEAFDNGSIRRILRVRRRDCVPSVELHRRNCLTGNYSCKEGPLVWTRRKTSRRWAYQGPSPSHTASHVAQTTWATTIKADLEPISGPRVFGHTRWRKDWEKVFSELAQDRRAWSASVWDVVNADGDAGSTRPGWMPTQVQVESKNAKSYLLNLIQYSIYM